MIRSGKKMIVGANENEKILLYALSLAAVGLLVFSVASLTGFKASATGAAVAAGSNTQNLEGHGHAAAAAGGGGHTLTEFDRKKALEFMDANHDGKCDACGMLVEECIDSGHMQCGMDSNAKIGVLGTEHAHADFKVFVNGKAVDFGDEKFFHKSSFLHLDEDENKEIAKSLLHKHATGVPLSLFFESVGGSFNDSCLVLPGQSAYCNGGGKTLKFFVNGEPRGEFGDYVLRNLDKILVSYGDANENVSSQLASITDYAKTKTH